MIKLLRLKDTKKPLKKKNRLFIYIVIILDINSSFDYGFTLSIVLILPNDIESTLIRATIATLNQMYKIKKLKIVRKK